MQLVVVERHVLRHGASKDSYSLLYVSCAIADAPKRVKLDRLYDSESGGTHLTLLKIRGFWRFCGGGDEEAEARIGWNSLKAMALKLGLPGVEETTSWGEPTLKAHGKLWVWWKEMTCGWRLDRTKAATSDVN